MRRVILNRRRLAAGAAILTAVFAAAAAFRQWVLPYCVPLPEEELMGQQGKVHIVTEEALL